MSPAKKRTGTRKPAHDGNTGATGGEDFSFEEGMERVEEIIEQIESGEIGLEESIEAFERASAMLARCEQVLERARQRVMELTPPASEQGPGSAKKGRVGG